MATIFLPVHSQCIESGGCKQIHWARPCVYVRAFGRLEKKIQREKLEEKRINDSPATSVSDAFIRKVFVYTPTQYFFPDGPHRSWPNELPTRFSFKVCAWKLLRFELQQIAMRFFYFFFFFWKVSVTGKIARNSLSKWGEESWRI